jgi:hypothetical protein
MENNALIQRILKIAISLVAVVAVVTTGYFYNQVRILKQNPQTIAQHEASDLVAKVSKLIMLPVGETPTVATVSDPSLLKDQPFFALAKKGDKVLIYAQAKKAILYSVSMDKIIDVAPLNIGAQAAVTPPVAAPAITTPTTKKP